MAIVATTFQTISCNSCDKTVTFDAAVFQTPAGQKETIEANPWLRTYRMVNSILDGRVSGYCSDECLLKAVEVGTFNPIEKKVIEFPTGGNLDAIKRAAAAAKAAEEGTKALKDGRPVNIQPAQ
jgi:hypothetical protein